MSILNYYDPEINTSGGGSEGTLGPSLVRAPVGTIVVWSGDMDNIPDGWALCDGQDGRPDLRDKFVLGAGGTYNPGAAGTVGSGGDLAYSAQCYIIKVTADATDGLTGEVYSTEEIRIGTWIDGRPLYRKCYTGLMSPGQAGQHNNYLDISSLNINECPTCRGMIGRYSTPIDNGTVSAFLWLTSSKSGIAMYINGSSVQSQPVSIIVEYTKTTDQATIEIPSILDTPALLPADTEMLDNELNPEEV